SGGDLFETAAGIEVLSSPMAGTDRYFSRSAGTSLSTPLVTSMAAEILKFYPGLLVQTVKAIMLNTTEMSCGKKPAIFNDTSLKGVLKKLTGFGSPVEENLLMTNENAVTFIIEDNIDLEEVKTIDIRIPKRLLKDKNKLSFISTLCYSFNPIRENFLNYCPLQIVFGFFRPSTAAVLANEKAENYIIKRGLSWSEDTWAPEGRFYCNVQQQDFYLHQQNLESIGHKVTLGIKCTGKKEIGINHRELLEAGSHPFSLVVTIAEVPESNVSGELYNQIIAMNRVQNIISTDIDLDLNI
ncbi:MAG: S8 family serine peptidase, partial [Ginsengibacter sp.]